jgi:hypothetical protein
VSVPDALPRGVLGGHIRTVWDVITEAVVPSGADCLPGLLDAPLGAEGTRTPYLFHAMERTTQLFLGLASTCPYLASSAPARSHLR